MKTSIPLSWRRRLAALFGLSHFSRRGRRYAAVRKLARESVRST
ncbi:MAG: hypothetical protein R3E46_14890 [Sedimenticolaceae bacterium]